MRIPGKKVVSKSFKKSRPKTILTTTAFEFPRKIITFKK